METVRNRKFNKIDKYNTWIINGDYLNDQYDEEKNEYDCTDCEDNCFIKFIRKLVQIFAEGC
jgi:hypothetical protein